jgi:transposase-like protein
MAHLRDHAGRWFYSGIVRYPDGGGLTAAGRVRRERARLQAARMYEQDVSPVRVAYRLRVSAKSAYQWWRCWRAGGEVALAPSACISRAGPPERSSAPSAKNRQSYARWTQ